MAEIVAFKRGHAEAPITVRNRVTGGRATNEQLRPRGEWLTEDEVSRLMKAARSKGRHRHRDSTMIQMAYRHGFRVSELIDLRWDQLDFKAGTVYVKRLKGSSDSQHPLVGDEIRALRRLQREYPKSPHVFVTERGGPMTRDAFQKIVARAGLGGGFGFRVHPHQLRHATGYALANRGVDTRSLQGYLGHRNIAHTIRYAELSSERFRTIWD